MENTFSKRREILILTATIIASGMAFLDGTVVNIAVPSIQNSFHAAFDKLLWVLNAFPLFLASFLLISGSFSDRYGRKRIFVSGILLFSIASFICAISGSVTMLAIARALQGLGAAMMIPGSLAIINLTVPHERRGRAIGLWSGFAGGIAAIGPFVGGWLVQHFSWHAIFYINLPLGLAAFLLAIYAVPESRNENAKSLDWWGTLFILMGLFGISYGLISAPRISWHNPTVLVSLIVGVLSLIVFYFVEKRASQPLVPLTIFKSKLVLGSNLVTLFLYFALNGIIFFITLNMQQVQGLSPIYAGLALLPSILIITFLSGYGGTISDRIGPRLPMILGPLIVAAGMGSLILPGTHSNYFTSFMPGLILFGLGMSMVIAPLTKSALSVPEYYSGSASGINNAVARTASLLAIAILGAVAIPVFSRNLAANIQHANMQSVQKQEIVSQAIKLGGIDIPSDFSAASKTAATETIKQSFVHTFRIVMGINALLALLAGILSFIFIRPEKDKQQEDIEIPAGANATQG
jgi:EmrB/QacA subfamily drug resistance transporter